MFTALMKLSSDVLLANFEAQRVIALRMAKLGASLRGKRVSPHTLRHSTAMDLLHNGIGRTVIALWLGHESVETTQIYIHADMRLKEKALARVAAARTRPGRYKPDDALLSFLESVEMRRTAPRRYRQRHQVAAPVS
ncbi:MAG TPA: tyrosine-type recombinase/integrase [Rhizomicrobium sp.]|jgi:hypothetical protein